MKKSRQRLQSRDEQSAAGTGGRCVDIDLDDILSCAVNLACDILGTDTASIALADAKGALTFRTQRGFSQRFARRWQRTSSESLTGIVFRTGQPYASPDLQTDEHYSGTALAQEGIRALLLLPLKTGDEVIGCLYIGHRTPHDFSPDEVRLASLFADHVSMSVRSTTLLQQERQQRQRSEALLDVMSAPTLSLSLKQVLVKLCQSVLKLTIGERCGIFMFNEDTHTLDPIMSLGVDDPVAWEKFRASAGLKIPQIRGIGEAIKAHEPIIEEHAPGSHILPDFWIDTFGMKSLALYPLVHREKTVGLLYVDSLSGFVHFPAEEIETLAAIAKQAAVIIENARIYEREQQQRQRAEALVDVLSAAASDLGFRKVLATICQAVANITVGDRCSIFMADIEGRTLEPVMSQGIEDEGLWERFRNPPPGETTTRLEEHRRLFETITKWEDPLIIEDAVTSDLLTPWWVETFNLKSLVQYPLRVKDRTIGLMTVDAFRERVHFPQEEIDTLTAIAKQAAAVIENTRLYEQERRQRQRAEALVNVLSVAASDLSFRKVLATISQSVVDFSVGERCSIFLFNEETHTMEPVMAMGPGDAALFEKFRASIGLPIPEFKGIDEAMGAWEPIVEENAPASTGLPTAWVKEFEVKSAVVYPLVHREKTVGILVTNTFSHFTKFPKEEVETLAAVAKQAAIIIEYSRLHEQLQEQAITDYMTGLFNHRHVHKRLEDEFARAKRSKSPFAVMMMDVDKFKEFNDTYGHLQGDEALRFIAQSLRETLRATDIVGRYGGDEFLAILPDTTLQDAEDAAERVRSMLAERPFPAGNAEQSVALAMSTGIACYPDDSTTKDALVALADAALYAAKRLGGNRAVPASGATLRRTPTLKKMTA